MPFNRPTLSELEARTTQDFESRLQTAGAVLRRAVIKVLSKVVAGAAHLMHGYLAFIAEQVFADTAIRNYLLRKASIYKIEKVAATYASGNVDMTGTDGATIPDTAYLKRSDGARYKVQTSQTISSGTASIPVQAVVAGEDGNCANGVTLTLENPIAGVNSQGTVDSSGITGGNDEEDDDSLRDRLLDRIRRPPMGGAERDYEKWAREVAGVTRVWVYEEYTGPGTVGVTFVRDNDDPIIPDSGEVQAVQDYIDDGRRPVTAHVTVFAPVADDVDFNISITPDTPEIRTAVEAELEDLIAREGEPGGTIYLSQMNEAISIATGETDHTLNSPVANHVSAAGELPMMGTITWA